MLINGESGETFNLFVKFFLQYRPHGLTRSASMGASSFSRHFHMQEQKETARNSAFKKHYHPGSVKPVQFSRPDYLPQLMEGIVISGKRELKDYSRDYSRGLFRQMDDRPARCGIPACTTTIYWHGKPLGSHAVSGLAAIRHHISGFIYFFLMKMDG
jgi:hypothetical protein